MKKFLAGLVVGIAALLVYSATVSATGDTGWSCPAGTVHTYKLDDLSGTTFTVPAAPTGWEVLGVSIKAGSAHHDYPTATSGDIIAVKADTGHDVSHAHICKRRISWTSTTTTSSTTSTTTPDTTSTTSTTSTTTSPPTTPPATDAPTTTVDSTTSTSSPPQTSAPTTSTDPTTTSTPTSTEPATTTTTTAAPSVTTTTPTPSSTSPATVSSLARRETTVPTTLPETGSTDTLAGLAALLLALGGATVLATRRTR